jgi:hypothetical protein
MKTREEIKNIIPNTGYGLSYNYDDGFIDGYTKCQEDMTKDVEYWEGEFEHWYKQAMDMSNKYNELLNKQDSEQNEQLCECSSKILPNGKIQLHLCRKCNEELHKES